MSTLIAKPLTALAKEIWFDKEHFYVRLMDGRELSVPLEWFPSLRKASDQQRKRWRLIGGGVGIHWSALNEDISVSALLGAIAKQLEQVMFII